MWSCACFATVRARDVMNHSNCFETIVATNEAGECVVAASVHDCREVLLGASLDLSNGELAWNYVSDKENAFTHVMGMSQMTSMLKDKRRNEVYNAAITGLSCMKLPL